MAQEKILLAGPDSHFLATARIFFEGKGYRVLVAQSEDEAVEKSAEKPDFILLQFWEEPEEFDAAGLARRLSAGPRLAVFCLTDLRPDALKHFSLSQVFVYSRNSDFQKNALAWLKAAENPHARP